MKEFLQETINLFYKILNNEDTSNFKYSKNDYVTEFHNIEVGCSYLVSFPKDKKIKDENEINLTIQENLSYEKTFLLGSKACEDRIRSNSLLKKFIDGEEVDFSQALDDGKKYLGYSTFEIDGNFLYEYLKNDNRSYISINIPSYNRVGKECCSSTFLIPRKIENINSLPANYIVEKQDNLYLLKLKHIAHEKNFTNLYRCKTLGKNKNDEIKHILECEMPYILKEDGNIYFDNDDGDENYNAFSQFSDLDGKIIFIDKDGNQKNEELNNNYTRLLKKIRDFIAHNKNTFDYIFHTEELDNPIMGKIFLLNDNAIVMNNTTYQNLEQILMKNDERESNEISLLYTPKIDRVIKNEEQLSEYLNACLKTTITFSEETDKDKICAVFNHAVETYTAGDKPKKENEKIRKHIKSLMCDKIGPCEVVVQNIEDINLILKKCINNKFLEKKDTESQKSYLLFIIEEFYGFDILNKYILQKSGKSLNVSVRSKAIIPILTKICNIIDKNVRNKSNLVLSNLADELYITLCIYLSYVNLIYNNFDDDIDDEKSKLPTEERRKLESQLDPKMFSAFSRINKNKQQNERQEKIETLKNMKDVISVIRDNIAHPTYDVKISRNGNPENNILVFHYDPDKSKQNPFLQKIQFQITCKDFIKFIMNDVFVNYKPKEKIVINSYQDLIDNVVAKINNN